ncbi:hypothetical protein ABKV19_025869 [Rosa sericea]
MSAAAAEESSEAGTMGEEVLKLKEELSQCRLEMERLLTEKKRWRIKKKLLMRGIEKLEDKISKEREVFLCVGSENHERQITLYKNLGTTNNSMWQLEDELSKVDDELAKLDEEQYKFFDSERPCVGTEVEKKIRRSQSKTEKLDKLYSEMNKKRDDLLAFLETRTKNAEITDDVKALVRDHYTQYIETLKTDEDEYALKTKIMDIILPPGSSQKQIGMFGRVDSISPISAGISKILNFLRK